MSLLRRIALSNGNKARKNEANATIKQMDRRVVKNWNKKLAGEAAGKKTKS